MYAACAKAIMTLVCVRGVMWGADPAAGGVACATDGDCGRDDATAELFPSRAASREGEPVGAWELGVGGWELEAAAVPGCEGRGLPTAWPTMPTGCR